MTASDRSFWSLILSRLCHQIFGSRWNVRLNKSVNGCNLHLIFKRGSKLEDWTAKILRIASLWFRIIPVVTGTAFAGGGGKLCTALWAFGRLGQPLKTKVGPCSTYYCVVCNKCFSTDHCKYNVPIKLIYISDRMARLRLIEVYGVCAYFYIHSTNTITLYIQTVSMHRHWYLHIYSIHKHSLQLYRIYTILIYCIYRWYI